VILRPLVRRTVFAGFTPQIQLDGPQRLDDYGVGAEMIPVGGHTPGSYVVLLDDGDAIVGDLIRGGFASDRIRPGHPLRHFFTEDRPPTAQRCSASWTTTRPASTADTADHWPPPTSGGGSTRSPDPAATGAPDVRAADSASQPSTPGPTGEHGHE